MAHSGLARVVRASSRASISKTSRRWKKAAIVMPGRHFSKAYIRHLFKANEMLAYRLISIHNIHFLNNLMEELRQAIREDRYPAFREEFFANYQL